MKHRQILRNTLPDESLQQTPTAQRPANLLILKHGISNLSGLPLLLRVSLVETLEIQMPTKSIHRMPYYLTCFFPVLLLLDKFKPMLASAWNHCNRSPLGLSQVTSFLYILLDNLTKLFLRSGHFIMSFFFS